MLLNKEKGYKIYLSFLQTVLTLALIWWVNEYFMLKVPIVVCIFFCLAFAVLIYFFDNSKNSGVRFVVLLSLPPSLGLVFLIFRTNPFLWVKSIASWCIKYDRTDELYELMPAYTVLAVISCLASILLYLSVKKLLIRMILAAAVLVVFIIFGALEINLDKVVVGIGIFYILCCLIEMSGFLYSKKAGKDDKKESILYLLPVCLLLTIISVGLPSRPEPIQWKSVKNIYYAVRDKIDKLITEWEFFTGKGDGIFSISLSGYSEESSLDNEDLAGDKKIALIIKGRKGLSPLYLTGSVSDTYTGYSWEKSDEGYLADEEEYQIDYAELVYGLSRLESRVFDEYRFLEKASINIYYKNIRTKTFFYPSKSYWFEFLEPVREPDTKKAGITFPKAMGDKVAYSVSYYEMNLREAQFQEMLRSADSFSYEKNEDINFEQIELLERKLYLWDKDDFLLNRNNFYELLKKRSDIIRKIYTQLPENLPERVRELAREITGDKGSNYDKLKAIEVYLLKYPYSYTPGKVPEGYDFVDYFLFENKKGYCTSFATSMAVLARCVGIPTRYVEGFLVDYSEKTDGGFLVRNSNAHAWVEAYFEGVGWIPFEPTPNFHELRYTVWPSASKETGMENYGNNIMVPKEQSSDQTPEKTVEKLKNNENSADVLVWVLFAAGIVLILFGAITCYYLLLRYRYRKEYIEADYSRKMYMIFVRILLMLKYEGFTLGKQETLLMLSNKVKDRLRFNNIIFSDVADIYMAYRYGEIPVSKEALKAVETFYKGLSEYRKSKSKKFKLLLEDFIFLIRKNSLDIIT